MSLLMNIRSSLEFWSLSIKKTTLGYYLIEMLWVDMNTVDCEFTLRDLTQLRDELTALIDSENERIQNENI